MEISADGADMMSGDLLVAVGNTQLPGDLMMLIVSRLPVESVLRFKSVCRAWCALFNSPMFIQRHCRVASSSAKLNNLLSFLLHIDVWDDPIFFLLVDRSCGKRTSLLLNPPSEVEYNFYDIQVVGSINGLVCFNFLNDSTSIVLWNPATRMYRQIPNPQLLLASNEFDSVGFAYDEKTDTYKVIRIMCTFGEEQLCATRVEIYNTGTNTWRTIEAVEFPWVLEYQRTCGAVVSGSPYWFARESGHRKQLVMWFDPSVDAFRFQPMPFENLLTETIVLGAIGEYPVVYSESFRTGKDESVTLLDVWKLNKFVDGGSDPVFEEKVTIEFISSVRLRTALGFRGKGEIIASSESRELYICDSHSTQHKITHHSYVEWGTKPKVYDYIESLVSPFMLP